MHADSNVVSAEHREWAEVTGACQGPAGREMDEDSVGVCLLIDNDICLNRLDINIMKGTLNMIDTPDLMLLYGAMLHGI